MKERETALAVLERVFNDNSYISLLLRSLSADPCSMPFITETVYGTVRNYCLLEYQWRRFVSRHVKRRTALLLDLSCYQLFFMDNEPAYAVVNDAVNLAGKNESAFINAIMHKVIKQGLIHSDDIAVETSHPQWLLSLWKAHYGEQIMKKTARADQQRGQVTGRINPLKITKQQLEQDPKVHFLDDLSFQYDGILLKTNWFKKGEVLIQDLHSTEAACALKVKPGMKVLDMCAAPGTKTQLLAGLMHNEGIIEAGDLYPERLSLIDAQMEKTGVQIVETKAGDATTEGLYEKNAYDRVLCDVPCSGLGDLRHKPEIRFHITPEKIDQLLPVQASILNNAAEYLREDGLLVYSTCTLNKKENEKQVQKFLNTHADFILLEEKTRFTFEDNSDGFYHAVLKKTGK